MQLVIDGTVREFETMRHFRERYVLPDAFGIAMLQPKTWDGQGSIERAGEALIRVRERTVAAMPAGVSATDWLTYLPELVGVFERELIDINTQVCLKDVEIDYAVNGFSDVCNALVFALTRASLTRQTAPPFDAIYREWLYSTVQVGSVVYPYSHDSEVWSLRVIAHAYGRIGLEVRTADEVAYVVDRSLACPAEGYMTVLLRDVYAAMTEARVSEPSGS